MHLMFGQSRFVDRVEYGLSHARGKRTLHIGSTGGNLCEDLSLSVHSRFHSISRYCVGIDIIEEQVTRHQNFGFNTHLLDAEDFDLGEQFEFVYAGEVIEHLSNPGNFLKCANRHLMLGGEIVLSTPLPWTFDMVLNLAILNNYQIPHRGHTCWFDPFLLSNLLERFGFRVIEVRPSGLDIMSRFSRAITKIRPGLAPEFTILAEKSLEYSYDDSIRGTASKQITKEIGTLSL